MTLNEVRKAYTSKKINVNKAINEICNYLVELDRMKIIDIVDWTIIELNPNTKKSSYDYYFKEVDGEICITVDTLEEIIMLTLKLDRGKSL